MTEAQKLRMLEARRQAQAERDREAVAEVARFRSWLREDARAFHTFQRAIETHGRSSSEACMAHAEWRVIAQRMPEPPRDAAWQQVTTLRCAA